MNGGKFEVGQDEVTVTAPERTMDCIERPRCDTNEGVAIEVTVTSEQHTRTSRKNKDTEKRREGCIQWGRRERPRTERWCLGTGACRSWPRARSADDLSAQGSGLH